MTGVQADTGDASSLDLLTRLCGPPVIVIVIDIFTAGQVCVDAGLACQLITRHKNSVNDVSMTTGVTWLMVSEHSRRS